jgi:hypothetical protein
MRGEDDGTKAIESALQVLQQQVSFTSWRKEGKVPPLRAGLEYPLVC